MVRWCDGYLRAGQVTKELVRSRVVRCRGGQVVGCGHLVRVVRWLKGQSALYHLTKGNKGRSGLIVFNRWRIQEY